MKKITLVLVALLTLVFTGCKTEDSKVTVNVHDTLGVPVANRYVLYADYASIITEEILPSPEALLTDIPDYYEYAQTNAAGSVVIPMSLSVSKIKYYFTVFDEGSNKWIDKTVELKRGVNEEINFEVNK